MRWPRVVWMPNKDQRPPTPMWRRPWIAPRIGGYQARYTGRPKPPPPPGRGSPSV